MLATLFVLLCGIIGMTFFVRHDGSYGGEHKPMCESPIEWRMYNLLVRNGYKVITQKQCGVYRIDMILPEYGIAIECDGRAFHSSPEQKRRDAKRTRYLRKMGWKSVLRFTGSEICSRPDRVLRKIENKIRSAKC